MFTPAAPMFSGRLRIDQSQFAIIKTAAEYITTHVSYERVCFRNMVPLRAFHGIICGVMQVCGISRYAEIFYDVRVVPVFG